MQDKIHVAILGDGGWGTAMALLMDEAGHIATIWSHDPEYLDTMRHSHANSRYLPGITLPGTIRFEADVERAMAEADLVITAIPSKFLRPVLSRVKGALPEATPVMSLTKGFDAESRQRPSQVIRECLGAGSVVALSGPSHAEEIAKGMPASVVIASDVLETARRVQHIVSTPRFRVYASGDIIGVEVAGAVKNVIALAAGILQGMGLGDNALAALATRGLVEMTRLGVALGGDPATFAGLAGMGDLITTCISRHGRNRAVGELLASGRTLPEILEGMNGVPEGVTTTSITLELARAYGVDMPITEQVAAVLWDGKSPESALHDLMTRARKDED